MAIGVFQLAVTGASLNGGVLVLARNVIGITGIGLLASLVTGGLLAWILPMAYVAFAEYALIEAWRSPWTWPVRPPDDRGAWICAAVVFAVGLAAFTVRGARARPRRQRVDPRSAGSYARRRLATAAVTAVRAIAKPRTATCMLTQSVATPRPTTGTARPT